MSNEITVNTAKRYVRQAYSYYVQEFNKHSTVSPPAFDKLDAATKAAFTAAVVMSILLCDFDRSNSNE